MRQAIKSMHLWVGLALLSLFIVSAWFIPNSVLLILSNSLLLCASFAVGVAYIPIAWRAVRSPDAPPRMVAIALGICYAWCFGTLWRVLILIWLLSGLDPVMAGNDLVALGQSGVAYGALLHLTTIDKLSKPDQYSMHWKVIGAVALSAAVLASVLIFFHPDLTEFALRLHPYIPR